MHFNFGSLRDMQLDVDTKVTNIGLHAVATLKCKIYDELVKQFFFNLETRFDDNGEMYFHCYVNEKEFEVREKDLCSLLSMLNGGKEINIGEHNDNESLDGMDVMTMICAFPQLVNNPKRVLYTLLNH